MRKEASDNTVADASSLTQDKRLPNFSIEFRLDKQGMYVPGRWTPAPGLGAALENYVLRLTEMEKVRYAHSVVEGLTAEHHLAFSAVVTAADALAGLGWPINWEQNMQTILELTEFGIREGKLVDRFSMPPEVVALGDELLLLGTITFHHQRRSADGLAKPFKSKALSSTNRDLFESIPLHLRKDGDELPARFRYVSDWISNESGASFRLAV